MRVERILQTYYLKKKNDWLLLVEVADSLSIVNEFPIIPLLQKLKSKVIDVNKLEIFPSTSIIYKELQIFFEETKEGSKVYNVSFELTNKEKHVVISEEDSLLISKDDLICQFNLNISLHTGEILFYSSDCSNNYIW